MRSLKIDDLTAGTSDVLIRKIKGIKMIEERYKKHIFRMPFDKHPSFIKERLSKLEDHHFGNDLFGIDKSLKRGPKDYISALNEMYFHEVILYLNSIYKTNSFYPSSDSGMYKPGLN